MQRLRLPVKPGSSHVSKASSASRNPLDGVDDDIAAGIAVGDDDDGGLFGRKLKCAERYEMVVQCRSLPLVDGERRPPAGVVAPVGLRADDDRLTRQLLFDE